MSPKQSQNYSIVENDLKIIDEIKSLSENFSDNEVELNKILVFDSTYQSLNQEVKDIEDRIRSLQDPDRIAKKPRIQ
jgi:hypothetical protein